MASITADLLPGSNTRVGPPNKFLAAGDRMILPKIPKRWPVRGEIPNVDPARAKEAELDLLDEDLLQITDSSGQYTLDVGWYPAASPDGQFVCRLVRSDDWSHPIDQMETKSTDDVRKWLKQAIEDVRSRTGTAGQFSRAVGVFIRPMSRRTAAVRRPARPVRRVQRYAVPAIGANSHTQPQRERSVPEITTPSTTAMQPFQSAYVPVAHAP